ncbi:MAG TPA: hypothetical protein VFK86_12690 [Bauldia sp.]|nr:hypothetical protein [Bauldia sp.]
MGVTLSSGRGGIIAAVVLAVLVAGKPAEAQNPWPGVAGPDVAIVGEGGHIRAAGGSVTITGTASRVEAVGARVEVNAAVTGPVYAAGALVTIHGVIEGDLKAGGGTVEVNGRLGGPVKLASAALRFNGTADRSVEAVGASLEFGPASAISGRLSAAGAHVVVAGRIGGPVRIGGASVTFNAEAAGDVILDAGRVTIGPNAAIAGNLVVRTLAAPEIADSARITGEVIVREPSLWWLIPRWLWHVILAAAMAAGTALAGLILIGVARGAFEDGLSHATFRPLSSGLIGIVTLILLPIVAALLMATIVGLSFGLALLLLVPFLVVAGHTVVATCIGVWIFDRTGEPRSTGRLFLYLLAGAIVVAAVWLIPWAGPILVGLAILVGTGAWMRGVSSRLSRRNTLSP